MYRFSYPLKPAPVYWRFHIHTQTHIIFICLVVKCLFFGFCYRSTMNILNKMTFTIIHVCVCICIRFDCVMGLLGDCVAPKTADAYHLLFHLLWLLLSQSVEPPFYATYM